LSGDKEHINIARSVKYINFALEKTNKQHLEIAIPQPPKSPTGKGPSSLFFFLPSVILLIDVIMLIRIEDNEMENY
jgi:hypothetical protein